MDYVQKLKQKYGQHFLFVLDMHGHSTRKNSFFFGPEFPIFSGEYVKARLLPKLYAQQTPVFRFYSCRFRVESQKANTARGYFNSLGVKTYTHETSIHGYFHY